MMPNVTNPAQVPADEESIMTEIFLHGSVTAGMTVYNDFFAYSSGATRDFSCDQRPITHGPLCIGLCGGRDDSYEDLVGEWLKRGHVLAGVYQHVNSTDNTVAGEGSCMSSRNDWSSAGSHHAAPTIIVL
jgi:hypothetical protein